MKIIDFEKKGNVVRFYLGEDACDDYFGDDWDDTPYEHNAGQVYEEYVVGYRDIAFPFDYAVLEPCDGHCNSSWCKDDMKARKAPCIIVNPDPKWLHGDEFDYNLGDKKTIKFYFGDKMEPSDTLERWSNG